MNNMIFVSLIATPPPWSHDRWRNSEEKKKETSENVNDTNIEDDEVFLRTK